MILSSNLCPIFLKHPNFLILRGLIPKNDSPYSVTDIRPISLYNGGYKVISKILVNHLKLGIHNLVGPEQNGFFPGWSTFDNILEA